MKIPLEQLALMYSVIYVDRIVTRLQNSLCIKVKFQIKAH